MLALQTMLKNDVSMRPHLSQNQETSLLVSGDEHPSGMSDVIMSSMYSAEQNNNERDFENESFVRFQPLARLR